MFELQVRRAKGYAYEDLFKSVMQRRYAEFTPIRPYGNLGDRKNDGYVPSSGTFYQLYAPSDPSEKLGQAAAKAKDDFQGLKDYWQSISPIKVYRFTFNDHFDGSVAPIEAALAAIAQAHSIVARPFLAKDLEAEFLELSLLQMQDVLCTVIPEPGLLADANYTDIRDVVEHVLNASSLEVPIGKLVAPEFEEKIAFNGLSSIVGRLLSNAALQTSVVEDYFRDLHATRRQDLRNHLAAIYAKEKVAAQESSLQPDKLFFALLESATPKSSRMRYSVQQAALVVLAYFFEACDIFEGPDAST